MIVSESRTRKEIKKTTKKKKKRIPRNDNIEWNHRPTEYRRRKKMIKFRMSKDSDSMMIKYRFFLLSFIHSMNQNNQQKTKIGTKRNRSNEWMNEWKQQKTTTTKWFESLFIYFYIFHIW